MLEDIKKCMRAFIVQHCRALAALATLAVLRQHLEAKYNDKQINSLENHVPHINAPIEFNQDTSKFARECRNCLQKEQRAKERTKSVGASETPQERSNRLRQERQIVQQATTRAQPSLGNDTLQLFAESAGPSETPQK